MAQLPAGAEGTAAGVLVWSFTCFWANILLQWLLWTGNERRSYIFVVTCVTLLSTTSSIIQQIYDIINYEDIMNAQLALIKANVDNAMVVTTMGTVPGVDLVMWTIRWGCYVAECGIACFWSFTLCQSVYGWRDDIRFHRYVTIISEAGKPFSILAAVLTMGILQSQDLQKSSFWWSFVLNFFYCAFCAGGLFWFFFMFIEYFQTRRLFRRMNSQQRRDYERQPSPIKGRTRSNSTATSMMTVGRIPTSEHFGALAQRQGGIYDKYLIARTFIPCIALCLFEIDNILLINQHPDQIQKLVLADAPDLSAAAAQAYFASFIPGCLASLILALAFGTTKHFRVRLHRLFVVACKGQSKEKRHRYGRSKEYRYNAMDSDNGILSRQKRLSMEKRLRIEVTYEFEIRNESAEMAPSIEDQRPPVTSSKKGETSLFPYDVENHRWNEPETATILPKKPTPSVSMMRGQF